MEKTYDIIIIGAGAAGITAALFAARRSLRTLVLSKDLGGQAASTTTIENYPGIFSIDGQTLMEQFYEQATRAGAEFIFSEVVQIGKNTESFFVVTSQGQFQSRALILASGLSPRDLEISGEEKFKGRGIFFDVVNKDEWWKKKVVGVVGGGNSACTFAIKIAPEAEKLYFIHRTEQFRAEPMLVERLRSFPQVEFVLNARIKEIRGEDFLSSVLIEEKGEEKELSLSALFLAIGFQPRTEWIKNIVPYNEKKEIVVTLDGATFTEGIFAAGDITTGSPKQIISSAGDGCKAAIAAHEYLCKKDGRRFVLTDWS